MGCGPWIGIVACDRGGDYQGFFAKSEWIIKTKVCAKIDCLIFRIRVENKKEAVVFADSLFLIPLQNHLY